MNRHPAQWWHAEEGGLRCELCPRDCLLQEGQRGVCGVRQVEEGALWTRVHGVSAGLWVDPVEKKPLYHWFPGSSVLSFGTAGCTLACTFCQNAALSQSRAPHLESTSLAAILAVAKAQGCRAVAFTYNEPLVAPEWTLEVAQSCREAGLGTLAVSSGHANPGPAEALFAQMDAANVDLKAFSEAFYRKHCGGHLQSVLDTLLMVKARGCTWLEVTTLLIPGLNDGESDLRLLAAWMVDHLGPEVPLHFSAFHPAHRLLDCPPTPLATLQWARDLAREEGLRHVYLGNVRALEGSFTRCTGCGTTLIQRQGYRVTAIHLDGDRCPHCGLALAGRFT